MGLEVNVSNDLQYYFMLVVFFLGGYWLAFMFKNMSNLFERLGIFLFVFLMVWFVVLMTYILVNVEARADMFITGVYSLGFLIRFFQYD